jgi:hypothetical protein
MVTVIELFESSDPSPLHFCLWNWMKGEVYIKKVDIRDELLARILDAAARIKKRQDPFRRKTRDLRTQLQNALRLTVKFSNIYCEL